MKLTNKTPENWRELEKFVANIFNDSGYVATTPYKVATARGDVEVDVYVKPRNELEPVIICECKHWNTPIPQEKVHAFRTVVNDSGAGMGLIISKVGFQEGAYNASVYSNIKLVTWNEFLELFIEKWFQSKRSKLLKKLKYLAVFTDPLDIPAEKLTASELNQYKNSILKYMPLLVLNHQYKSINEDIIHKYNEVYKENISTYEEYFEETNNKINEGLSFYDELFSNSNIPPSHFYFDMESIMNGVDYDEDDVFS